MLPPLMFLHWLFAIKFLMTNVAFKWPVISVGSFVHLQWVWIYSLSELYYNFKDIDCNQFISPISSEACTYPKISFLCVLLAANFTAERFFSSMCDKMTFHCSDTNKTFSANPTNRQNFRGSLSNTFKNR